MTHSRRSSTSFSARTGPPGGEDDVAGDRPPRGRRRSARRSSTTCSVGTVARVLRRRPDGRARRAHRPDRPSGSRGSTTTACSRVEPLGNWEPRTRVGQRFSIKPAAGDLVPASSASAAGRASRRGTTSGSISACTGRDEARGLVAPGDAVVFVGAPVELAGGRFTSPAIDNRAASTRARGAAPLRRRALRRGTSRSSRPVQEEGSHRTGAEAIDLVGRARRSRSSSTSSYASDAPWPTPALGTACPRSAAARRSSAALWCTRRSAPGLLEAAAAVGAASSVEVASTTLTDGDDLFTIGSGGLAVGLDPDAVATCTRRRGRGSRRRRSHGDIVEAYVRGWRRDARSFAEQSTHG